MPADILWTRDIENAQIVTGKLMGGGRTPGKFDFDEIRRLPRWTLFFGNGLPLPSSPLTVS